MAGVRRFDEEEVLAKAEIVFRRKGYDATSMLDLADATGVQRGSLYNAYGDKEALFLLTFARYEARFLASAEEVLAGDDIRAGLTGFFDLAIANMTAGTPAPGCLTTKTAAEGALTGPRIREEVQGLLETLDGLLRAAFRRAKTPLPLSPKEASRMVVTFSRGLAVMERVHGDPRVLRETARNLIDLLAPAHSSV